MLERRCEGSPIRLAQLGGFFLFPQIKKLLQGDFGPVNVPRIAVVFRQKDIAFFPCGRIADNLKDWLPIVFPTPGFLDDVRAAAFAGQPRNRSIAVR